MNKIIIITTLLLLIIGSVKAQEGNKLNVLMIAVDDMNNWVGSWGGKAITPHIDQLAAAGVAFKNAHCIVPACNPSRAALLTGLRPETTGQYTNEGWFRERTGGEKWVTLPQFLQKNGYKTVAAGKIFHHPAGTGITQRKMSDSVSWNEQFPVNVGTPGAAIYHDEFGYAKWLEGDSVFGELPIKDYIRRHGIWGPIDTPTEACGDWLLSDFCANYLQGDHDDPFLLACGIFRPHSPQLAPQKYFDMYPIEEIELPDVPTSDMDDVPSIAQSNWSTGFADKLMSDTLEWKRAVQAYLACITFADDCIGHVLNSLENSKNKDNTVVVFWSDHGWQLGHKHRWEKFSLWDQSTNSPMIIKLPGQVNRPDFNDPVSFLDIYPTVVDLLDLNITKELEGHSLKPIISGEKTQWNHPAVITYQENNNSVRFKQWNYIRYKDGTEELYDHCKDPNEYHNLAGQKSYKKIMNKLRKHIPQVMQPQDEYVIGG